ncbi:hypothetical protein [Ornithinimicrobium kibberense]|uniref:hypothetical protein n=1 Tax=Ornithinimicrobium kibberense TaxID=282060 RepID=UPI00360619DA
MWGSLRRTSTRDSSHTGVVRQPVRSSARPRGGTPGHSERDGGLCRDRLELRPVRSWSPSHSSCGVRSSRWVV